ncbi:SRA stem-loop-interacting RNA-binding protein, mitochondrial-like [Actinia tenebrosa]|uniref:SRA stem-loop-interacting RNA-binding protein, mitochondrial-like n=1 Tax=Actinia tenebrosa TaxID=6105 RepID=A0A6P8GZ36_ACTTE|nr:SRA stem-loop-interacting RNA-binding protein, mitochondrial-like [Actinia tenebrosa]
MAARQIANRLFVARLPWTASRDDLTTHFSQYGKILTSKIIFDMKSGRSKKYGFVFFADEESCEKAVADDKHVIDGQKVAVEVMTANYESRRRQDR